MLGRNLAWVGVGIVSNGEINFPLDDFVVVLCWYAPKMLERAYITTNIAYL